MSEAKALADGPNLVASHNRHDTLNEPRRCERSDPVGGDVAKSRHPQCEQAIEGHDEGEDGGNEQELARLDTEVEGEQRKRHVGLGLFWE